MKAKHPIILSAVLATALLSACAKNAGGASPTPDYCSPTNVKILAQQVNALTQQFDDESALAANVPQSQLAPHIAALQTIRRAAQEQNVPGCLAQLKALQVSQMNTVIATMLGFLGGSDQGSVGQGIAIARNQHDQYVLELARLLDVTPTIITPPPTVPATETPAVTPTAASAGATPPPAAASSTIVAVNPGPYPINLRAVPSVGGRLITTLDVGKSVVAVAETTDGLWVQVLVPGHPDQKAWISASDVQLVSGTANSP